MLALLSHWKLIAVGVLAVAAVTYHLIAVGNAREDGRQEVWAKVEQQAQQQEQINQAASIAALEALQDSLTRNERIIADAIAKIRSDCAVDPAVIDAFDKLRRSAGAGEGDNPG